MRRILFIMLFLFTQFECFSQNNAINPYKYIATLSFDGVDFFDTGETNFPQSYSFNTTQDANGDNIIDVEDNIENLIKFAISNNIYGTGRTGLLNRGPNDQRPAIYFHFVQAPNYNVYEYWLYYADNNWTNDHEHDWEKFFVYVQDTTPIYIMVSWHINFDIYSWCTILKDDGHPVIKVDGGSHAMGIGYEDGVSIRYNGDISKNNGHLDIGDSLTIPWLIYSNDANVLNAIPYIQSPDTFYYGDPVYLANSNEWGDPRPAPWHRNEWNNPPLVPIIYLGSDTAFCLGDSLVLDAGSGFNTYLWSTGATTQSIVVTASGFYTVTGTDINGCQNTDAVTITVNTADTSITQSENTLTANATSATYQWIDCNGSQPISGETNQSFTATSNGNYAVQVTQNGCTDTSACYPITSVGIGENTLGSGISIYPNPTHSNITIDMGRNFKEEVLIRITNINGQEVLIMDNINKQLTTINMVDLPEGMYFIHIQSKSNTAVFKQIKN